MDCTSKIISFKSASPLMDRLRDEGKCIVQCHGTFDLIHPGHIIHFEESKQLGDILVVTVTGEKYVNKGPGRPYFNDELRAHTIAALSCVDYVVLIPYAAAVEAIECIKPSMYSKGKEYQDQSVDVTGNIADDVKTVEKYGGRMAYVGSVVFSSTKLLNRHFEAYSTQVKDYCRAVVDVADKDAVKRIVENFSNLRVLVVGDLIFDQYMAVSVQGLTSKNSIVSGLYISEEMQAGGALAVYRHVRQFCKEVKLVGFLGTEPWVEQKICKYLKPADDEIVRDSRFTSIIKQRFVQPFNEGKELSKLFAVNYIGDMIPPNEMYDAILEKITAYIPKVDLVIAMDFGHGVFSEQVRQMIQEKAPFLALNCQTNSNNHGYNIINRQYQRADMFSLDQTELHLACGRKHINYGKELAELQAFLSSDYAWLTRGGDETLGMCGADERTSCPSFENSIVDTVGAGDAFCSLAALAAATGQPLKIATFLGQLAGAQAVRIIGNSKPINKGIFLKGIEAMLNL